MKKIHPFQQELIRTGQANLFFSETDAHIPSLKRTLLYLKSMIGSDG